MAAPRGHARYGGRKKGTPNKATQALTDAIDHAFDKVGGVDYLVRVAEEDPKTFCSLLGKRLPLNVQASGSLTLNVVTGVP